MATKNTNKYTKGDAGKIIHTPRITEKAAMISANNVYSFLVDPKSNKKEVLTAFETLFGKKPTKVNIVKYSPKTEVKRGVYVKKSGYKKAYIYLKKGDTINFM